MTELALSTVQTAVRAYLAAPSTRCQLRDAARRRGLSAEADDVVQTVLCEALAARNPPTNPSEIPRWVRGILKHKLADANRRRARWRTVELEEQGVAGMHPEVRDLLRRIDADIRGSSQQRALGWMLREHAGDSLLELARAEALAPTTLRQRLCRLRRYLRARYLAPLLFVLAAAGLGAAQLSVAQPPAATWTQATYAGRWQIVEASPAKYANLGLTVDVTPGGVSVRAPSGIVVRSLRVEREDASHLRLHGWDRSWRVEVFPHGANEMELRGSEGYLRLRRE